MGVNPGGDPEPLTENTVRWHTRRVLEVMPDNWSAYRDERWQDADPGTYGMQPSVLHLLRPLQLDPGRVPASNVVFLRSRRDGDLSPRFTELACDCWPVHQRVIEELGVKVVLCFGKTAGAWVRRQLHADESIGRMVEKNEREWVTEAFANAAGRTVVVTTHPSVVDWKNPDTDPGDLVRRVLDAHPGFR